MIDENALRELFVATFEYMRNQEKKILVLMQEVAALRETFEEASGGKFLPHLEKQRDAMEGKASSAKADLIGQYDEMIRRLKSGGVF